MSRPAKNFAEGDFGHVERKRLGSHHWSWISLAFGLPAVVGCWGTTQWFASKFDYSPALGAGSADGSHLYHPAQIFVWLWRLRGDGLPEAYQAQLLLLVTLIVAVMIALAVMSGFLKELKNRATEVHDSGRWGNRQELMKHKLLSRRRPKDGLFLGLYKQDHLAPDEKDRGEFVSENADTPTLVVSPPGGGKNVSINFPTLTTWQHSCLCVDPKLENYLKTAGYRQEVMNQRCGALNFLSPVTAVDDDGPRVPSLRYNPLDFIRLGTDKEVDDALGTAISFTDASGKGLGDAKMEHWVTTPAGLLAAGMLHVMYRAKVERWGRPATMFDVQWELFGEGHPAVEEAVEQAVAALEEKGKPVPPNPRSLINVEQVVLGSWLDFAHAGPQDRGWEKPNGERSATHLFIAMRAQEQLARMNTPEGSGHLSTVRKVLTLFEAPGIRQVTSRSDFRVEDFQAKTVQDGAIPRNGLSLYLVVPVNEADRFRPIYRAFLSQLATRLTEAEKPEHRRNRLLLLLDEGNLLGPIKTLHNLFAIGRGYGIKVMLVFQTLAQLVETWGHAGAESLLGNAATTIAGTPAPAATSTATRLSKMTGRVNLAVENKSTSVRAGTSAGANKSESERELARPLLTEGEVFSLPGTVVEERPDGRPVLRPDGTAVLRQRGHWLMFRRGIPVVRLLQFPHFADPYYLRRTKVRPTLLYGPWQKKDQAPPAAQKPAAATEAATSGQQAPATPSSAAVPNAVDNPRDTRAEGDPEGQSTAPAEQPAASAPDDDTLHGWRQDLQAALDAVGAGLTLSCCEVTGDDIVFAFGEGETVDEAEHDEIAEELSRAVGRPVDMSPEGTGLRISWRRELAGTPPLAAPSKLAADLMLADEVV